MQTITIRDDFIKLGQAMKLAGLVSEGYEAKEAILEGKVRVGDEVELRRGRKLYVGDRFTYDGQDYLIAQAK